MTDRPHQRLQLLIQKYLNGSQAPKVHGAIGAKEAGSKKGTMPLSTIFFIYGTGMFFVHFTGSIFTARQHSTAMPTRGRSICPSVTFRDYIETA